MQNKEKCLHATPLSETVLIPTIQIREGRKSKEEKKGMKETKRVRKTSGVTEIRRANCAIICV